MAENRRDVMDLFKAERINSLATLIEIRDNPETPASVRAMCCKDILDRKPRKGRAKDRGHGRGHEFGSRGGSRAA